MAFDCNLTLVFLLASLDSVGNPLQYQDLLGNGNAGGTPGDCPKGFVCLKNGNCGGKANLHI